MAEGLNVGAIYYEVEADTSKLVNSSADVDSSLDKMNRQFGKTDKAANQAQFQMTKTAAAVKGIGKEADASTSSLRGLSGVLAGLVTLQGARGLIDMADAYNEMAERVSMATASQAEYELVQQRLLNTANKTYRSLGEAQETYIRTADSIRTMGYTTDDALDITDSLSYSFVKNATSTDRANSAISAFTKSLNKGRVDAESWQTIIAATPSIINDIAASSGKTAAQIREMGVSGDISAKMLSEGLRQSLDSNRTAADRMATTLKDAFTSLRNNLSAYVGEANRASGATGILSSAVLILGENLDTIVKLLMIAGAGALAKYIAGLAAAAIGQLKASMAARQHSAEQLKLAIAQEKAAAAAAAQATANVRLGVSHVEAAAATRAHKVASEALAIAQAKTATAGASILGILGGPIGIVSLVASAAAGFLLFGTNLGAARKSVLDMSLSTDELIKKFRELGELQRGKEISTLGDELSEQAKKASKAVFDFANSVRQPMERGVRGAAKLRNEFSAELKGLVSDTNMSAAELESAVSSLIDRWAEQNKWTAETVQKYKIAAVEMTNAQSVANATAAKLAVLRGEQERLANSANNAADAQRNLNNAFDDAQTDDYLKRLQDRRAAIEDGNSATKAAERYIRSLKNVSEDRIKVLLDEAKAVDAASAAQNKYKTASSVASKAANDQSSAENQNKKVIEDLARQLYEAGLQGEALAQAKARASLNQFATQDEIANVEALAKAVYEASQYQPNKQLLGQVDPITGEEMNFQTQIENLRKLNEAKLLENERYLDLKMQAENAHDERMRALQEENFRRQSAWNDLLISSLDRVGDAATDTLVGLATGASNSKDAIRALAAAILQDGVGALVAMGAQYVKNLIIGETAGAAMAAASALEASALATAWAPAAALASLATLGGNAAAASAGIASTMLIAESSAKMGGGRLYGGSVDSAKMYRINENGAPEIFNAANGQQFMLPNRRGEVVSNKDSSASSDKPTSIVVNLYESAERAGQVESTRGQDGETVINAFVADIRGGGRASQVIEGTYGLNRRGS